MVVKLVDCLADWLGIEVAVLLAVQRALRMVKPSAVRMVYLKAA